MSAIQWTDHTVNPVIGCTKVSAGCKHCYASDLAAQMVRRRLPIADRYREVLTDDGQRWNGRTVVASAERLATMSVPRRKRSTDGSWRPARVFCGSMTDMFHESLMVDDLIPVWRWMAKRSIGPQPAGPTWQIVTKRPGRALALLPALQAIATQAGKRPRIHLLTSTEDQATADERVPELLRCRAHVELVGLSMEPLLGPVTLRPEWLIPHHGLGWIIVGGESGTSARPCHVNWVQAIVDQCRPTGTAVFVKQTGTRTVGITGPQHDKKGGDPREWPPAMRVREFPR